MWRTASSYKLNEQMLKIKQPIVHAQGTFEWRTDSGYFFWYSFQAMHMLANQPCRKPG